MVKVYISVKICLASMFWDTALYLNFLNKLQLGEDNNVSWEKFVQVGALSSAVCIAASSMESIGQH